MFSTKKTLSAIAGLAMLAIPVSALAGHKHENQERFRPYAVHHDNGQHRGWMRFGRNYIPPRVNAYRPGPLAFNGGDHDGDDWNHPGYRHPWDGDHDSYRWAPNYSRPAWQSNYAPNYRCDADGDECRWINNGGPAYWANNGGYNYGEPFEWYNATPPAGYGSAQQLNWLLARRQRAMRVIAQMRARGDSRGAARMVPIVQALNRRISRLRGVNYGANAIYPNVPASYVPPLAALTPAPAASYYGANNYYGTAAPYYGNSTLGALASVAGPLIGLP